MKRGGREEGRKRGGIGCLGVGVKNGEMTVVLESNAYLLFKTVA